jgi:coenzyme F420-reducing hydrogenase gamma subunit
MVKKLKIGIFGISGCAGCLLTMLYARSVLELSKFFKIKSFPLIKEDRYKGNFDIVFVEGTVTFDDDIITINELRKRTKILVALGTCACFGCVPSIKNFVDEKRVTNLVYAKVNHLKSVPPTPLDRHIKVDYYIPQCPPNKDEIFEFLKCMLLGKEFRNYQEPVCIECRKKENPCLLEIGKPCLGIITNGGCDAICPSNKVECYGCRGPTNDMNIDAFKEILKGKGYNEKAIEERIEIFAGLKFKEEEEKISKWLEK